MSQPSETENKPRETSIADPRHKAEAVKALRRNWLAEKQSARAYRDLADTETIEKRRDVLRRMADAEERHAARWAQKLADLGSSPPALADQAGGRLRRWWTRAVGSDVAIRKMEAVEDRQAAEYTALTTQALGSDADAQQILREIAVEEKAHAKALSAMAPQLGPQGARTVLDTLLKRERWHGRGGGWVADAIYGVNDGLGAVFGIVSGVAGATTAQQVDQQRHFILIAGLAGMLASALSMGAGAYLAVKSQREVHEAEIAREKEEIAENPAEEIEEMALFYQLQGFSVEESERMAEKLAEDPEQMVRAMAQNELGLSEEHQSNPWLSSFSAALSTGVGAFVPIIPFFFMGGTAAVVLAFIISLIAHFAVGAAKSLITIRSWWSSGFEMTMVGVIEAGVTYGLGRAFGAVG